VQLLTELEITKLAELRLLFSTGRIKAHAADLTRPAVLNQMQ